MCLCNTTDDDSYIIYNIMICIVENSRHFRPDVRNKGDSSRTTDAAAAESPTRKSRPPPEDAYPAAILRAWLIVAVVSVTMLLRTYIHCHLSPEITSGYRHRFVGQKFACVRCNSCVILHWNESLNISQEIIV